MRGIGACLAIAVSLAAAGAGAGPPANPDGIAVIVGNKAYRGGIPAVDYADRDAAAIRRFVVDVLGFPAANVLDLRDATQAEMYATFGSRETERGRLWGLARPGRSDILVYYSGHGVPGAGDRRAYLLPVDADPDVPEVNGYPLDLLYGNLARLEARSVTVFLDTCFSGDSERGRLIKAASGIAVEARVPAATGMVTLTAARGDQVASWDAEARHGLFTRHLLDALYGRADEKPFGDGDGRVTLAEAKAYLDETMTPAARRLHRRVQEATAEGDGARVLVSFPPGRPPARPSAAVAIEAVAGAFLAVRNANVRAAPEVGAPIVTTLAAGTPVRVTGKVKGANWYAVERDGRRLGFVFGELLREAAGPVPGLDPGITARPGDVLAALIPAPPASPPPVVPAVGVFPPAPKPGLAFKDCPECPEMVVVPAGRFWMGSTGAETIRERVPFPIAAWERPAHEVTIARPFALGRHEVTRAEFAAFARATGHVAAGGCHVVDRAGNWGLDAGRSWRDPGFAQTERDPVVCVSWADATAYTDWLAARTGARYRLPTEAEWEYAARAGTATARPGGDGPARLCDSINHGDQAFAEGHPGNRFVNRACRDGFAATAPAGSFRPNAFGLYDTLGNAWEWTLDCWHEGYAGAPADGGAWALPGSGPGTGDCAARVVRGGSWVSLPRNLRSAARDRNALDHRADNVGVRVARGF